MDSNRYVEEYADIPEYGEDDYKYECDDEYSGDEDDVPVTWIDEVHDEADVDSRSIGNQEKTKKHWEDKLSSSADVRLFPDQSYGQPTIIVKSDINDNRNVQIEAPVYTKLQLEEQAAENHWKDEGEEGEKYYDNDERPEYESAIDREIRLEQEREEELKRDHKRAVEVASPSSQSSTVRSTAASHTSPQVLASPYSPESYSSADDMPIHKVPAPVVTLTHQTHKTQAVSHSPRSSESSPSPRGYGSYTDMPEADQEAMMTRGQHESFIEREILEQQQRESELKVGRTSQAYNEDYDKEEEQSEYERQEKESERVNAHESIVEQEIRQQRERDGELSKQRTSLYGGQGPEVDLNTSLHTDSGSEVYEAPPPAISSPPPPVAAAISYRDPSPSPREQHVVISATKSHQRASEPLVAPPIERSYDDEVEENGSGGGITYERAIASQSHVGESRIARELREQREREEDLRSQWKERGMEVPEREDKPDTPYNMPEPKQPPQPKTMSALHAQAKMATYQKDVPHKTSTSQTIALGSGIHITTNGTDRGGSGQQRRASIDSDISNNSGSVFEKAVKVQPYAEPDENDNDATYKFVPSRETPVEREIRRAREREDELRTQKGLPLLSESGGGSRPQSIDINTVAHRPHALHSEDGTHVYAQRGAMKRLASSRLQHEIEQENQRESNLQSEGKIHTTSQERVGPSKKYTDIIPEQSKTPTTPKTPTSHKVPSQQHVTPSPTRQYSQTSHQPHQQAQKSSTPSTPIQNGPSSTPATPVTPTTPSASKAEPAVVRRYSKQESPRGTTSTTTVRSSMTRSESKIELELREMREREDDLKHQRELAGLLSPTQSSSDGVDHLPDDTSPPMPASKASVSPSSTKVTMRHTEPAAAHSDVIGPRRKSALAEEWEKKFGANA